MNDAIFQDAGRMIMKGCVQCNPVDDWKDLHFRQGSNLAGTARLVGQHQQ